MLGSSLGILKSVRLLARMTTMMEERLRRENDEYLLLEEKHDKLEREIRSLNRKHILTPEEEVVRKNLQKEKLLAKDLMIKILRKEEGKDKKERGGS